MTKYKKVELDVEPNISTRREVRRCEGCGELLTEKQVAKKRSIRGPRGRFVCVCYCLECEDKRQPDTELRPSVVKRIVR